MEKFNVLCQIENYSVQDLPSVSVKSCPTYENLVIIEVDEKKFAVDGRQLKKAVDYCMNT